MSTLRKLILNALVGMFGLFLALVLIEVLFRLTPSAPQKIWNDRPKKYFRQEAAKTLQDYAYAEKKPANVFRIVVVGDSYSFAPYMQFTDAFPKKLEQMLNLNAVGLKAEVLNYGVPAYSASHEVALVERAIREQADLILLQVTLNDPELKPYRPTGITDFSRFGAYQAPEKWTWLLKHWHSLSFVLQRLHNSKTHSEYKQYFIDLFENPRTWKPYTKSMTQMVELAGKANIKVAGLIFPLFGLPLDKNYPFFGLHGKVAALLQELKTPYLDLFAPYEGIPLERIQVMPGEDRHPNEIAHRIAAEKIYDWLVEQNLIPNELIVRNWFKSRTDIYGREAR